MTWWCRPTHKVGLAAGILHSVEHLNRSEKQRELLGPILAIGEEPEPAGPGQAVAGPRLRRDLGVTCHHRRGVVSETDPVIQVSKRESHPISEGRHPDRLRQALP